MQFLHCLLKDLYHQGYLLSSLPPQCLTNQYKLSELLVPNQRGKFNIKSCCIILIHVSVKSNLRKPSQLYLASLQAIIPRNKSPEDAQSLCKGIVT